MRSYYRHSYDSVVQLWAYGRGLTMRNRSSRVCAEGFSTEVVTGQGPHLDQPAAADDRNSCMVH